MRFISRPAADVVPFEFETDHFVPSNLRIGDLAQASNIMTQIQVYPIHKLHS
jgi:hypothetical protein